MPSSPDPKKLKEAGMDKAFNPKGGSAKDIMEKIAGLFSGGQPQQQAPAQPSCPTCGQSIGDQINYPQGPSK